MALSLGALCLALSVWSFRPAIFWGDPCFAGSLSEAKRSPTSHTLDAALGCQLRGWPRFDPRQPPIRGVAPVGRFVSLRFGEWHQLDASGGGPDSTLRRPLSRREPARGQSLYHQPPVSCRFGVPLRGVAPIRRSSAPDSGGGTSWAVDPWRSPAGALRLALSGWRSLVGALWLALSG